MTITTISGKEVTVELAEVGACYPDDDVIYFSGEPCILSSFKDGDEFEKAALYYKAALRHEIPPYIPSRVRLLKQVTSDPSQFSELITAEPGEYDVVCNQWGAVSIEGLNLGLKPREFDVIEWMENVK